MRTRHIVVAILWVVSLLGVGVWAQGGAGANQTPVQRPALPGGTTGPVLSGDNLGFQPIGPQDDPDGRLRGRFVVKVQGQWVPVYSAPTIIR
jgi:hypothetical protein